MSVEAKRVSDVWKKWEGEVINGSFPLRRFLSASDHSAVFLTQFIEQGLPNAAIKLMPADESQAGAQLSHWGAAAVLTHPGLVRILDAGRCQLGGLPFLYVVMEYAEQTLAQLLPQRALTAEEVQDMLVPTLGALRFLHRQNLVQGQLKPSNVLVVDDKLKLASDTVFPAGEFIASNFSLYDPPEAENGVITPAGDIWALGVTLVEALTRIPPVWDTDRAESLLLPPGFPAAFVDVVRQCLSRNPVNRPTVADLVARFIPTAELPTPSVVSPAAAVEPAAASREAKRSNGERSEADQAQAMAGRERAGAAPDPAVAGRERATAAADPAVVTGRERATVAPDPAVTGRERAGAAPPPDPAVTGRERVGAAPDPAAVTGRGSSPSGREPTLSLREPSLPSREVSPSRNGLPALTPTPAPPARESAPLARAPAPSIREAPKPGGESPPAGNTPKTSALNPASAARDPAATARDAASAARDPAATARELPTSLNPVAPTHNPATSALSTATSNGGSAASSQRLDAKGNPTPASDREVLASRSEPREPGNHPGEATRAPSNPLNPLNSPALSSHASSTPTSEVSRPASEISYPYDFKIDTATRPPLSGAQPDPDGRLLTSSAALSDSASRSSATALPDFLLPEPQAQSNRPGRSMSGLSGSVTQPLDPVTNITEPFSSDRERGADDFQPAPRRNVLVPTIASLAVILLAVWASSQLRHSKRSSDQSKQAASSVAPTPSGTPPDAIEPAPSSAAKAAPGSSAPGSSAPPSTAPASAASASPSATPPPVAPTPAAPHTVAPTSTTSRSVAPTSAVPHTTAAPPSTAPHSAAARSTESSSVPARREQHVQGPPGPVHKEIPEVPRSARDTIHGVIKVVVRVAVDRSGNVVGQALETPGPSKYFARLATQAARKWKFTPPGSQDSREWLLHFEFARGGTTAHATAAHS